jgi:hypothetical protein
VTVGLIHEIHDEARFHGSANPSDNDKGIMVACFPSE